MSLSGCARIPSVRSRRCAVPLPEDILGCLGHAVIVTDVSGIVTHWNVAAEELYGWPAAEAMGRPGVELIVPESMHVYVGSVVEQLQSVGTWSSAFTARRRDGSTFLAYATTTELRDASGDLQGIVGV